jgi:phage shock protein A
MAVRRGRDTIGLRVLTRDPQIREYLGQHPDEDLIDAILAVMDRLQQENALLRAALDDAQRAYDRVCAAIRDMERGV